MAKAKVTIENGFTYKGKPYAKGDEITAAKAQIEAWERLDFVKVVNETKGTAKSASTKGAAKKATTKGAAKKAGDTVALDTNETTENSDAAA